MRARQKYQKDAKLAATGCMRESDAKAESTGAVFVLRLLYAASRLFVRFRQQLKNARNVNTSKDRRIKPSLCSVVTIFRMNAQRSRPPLMKNEVDSDRWIKMSLKYVFFGARRCYARSSLRSKMGVLMPQRYISIS